MENEKYINELIARAKKAQKEIEFYSQEQVDAMARAVGKIIVDHKEELSREAVEETGMGSFDSKVSKHNSLGMVWMDMKGQKSVGILDEDPATGIINIAKPLGVVASICPSTNPTVTSTFHGMICMKTKNAVIVGSHPKACRCTAHAVSLMRQALEELNAPADLIQMVEEPTIEKSALLMAGCDTVLAVGGTGMVKAAYSSGRPAYAVGQGNVQVIIDKDYEDMEFAARTIVNNRLRDNGMPCAGEQMVFVPRERRDEVISAFCCEGAYLLEEEEKVDILRKRIFKNGILDRDIVGRTPHIAAATYGIEVPEEAKALMFELKKYGPDEVLCREIMFPVIRFIVYENFEEAVSMARANLEMEGAGHTAILYSKNQKLIEYAALRLPVGRVLVEQGGAAGSGFSWSNGLAPTFTLGCGSWGNNALSENLTFRHLLNVTKISTVIPNTKVPDYDEIWNS